MSLLFAISIMNNAWENLLVSAHELVTDRDIYTGLMLKQAPLRPDNIVIFARNRLRSQDYAGAVHHRYVLILFLESPGTVFIHRRRFSAQEKQAVLIRPFEQHYYALPSGSISWLFITFELPKDQSVAFVNPCSRLTPRAVLILQNLLDAYSKQDAKICGLLLPLLLYEINQSIPETLSAPDIGQKLAGTVNCYIHDHLNKRFTIHELAGHCGISASHLRLKFRKTMGVSLGQYIQRIRFDRACHLLQTTGLTGSEIAYQCGFTSPATFCRAFHNQAGCTPNAFRKGALDKG
jgi:AraC-like DNA-binding protein